MDAQRLVGIATVALLAIAVVGLVLALLLVPTDVSDSPPGIEAPKPAPIPAGTVAPSPRPSGPMARRAIPAPDRRARRPPPPGSPAARLSTEEWRDYNGAMHDVATKARDTCLRPYAQEEGLGKLEVVLDGVLWDGEIVDFGLRGLQDVPDHVLDCVGEVAWSTPFPEHDKSGELRLQRVVEVDGRRKTQDDNR